MSDTPRTDAVTYTDEFDDLHEMVPADFARQLERELAAKTHRVAELALLANNRLQKLENAEREVAELREALEYACEAEWDGLHEPVWMKNARAALKGSP